MKYYDIRGNCSNDELHNFSPPNVSIMIRSWRIRWAGYVAFMKEDRREIHIRFCLEKSKKKRP
jgi:hypothetical protein